MYQKKTLRGAFWIVIGAVCLVSTPLVGMFVYSAFLGLYSSAAHSFGVQYLVAEVAAVLLALFLGLCGLIQSVLTIAKGLDIIEARRRDA